MKEKPIITCIITVLNGEKYLEQTIKSILNQTFNKLELVIVDDGSKDKTWKILTNFAKKDKRIILLKNKKNIGINKSVNKALKIARGKYIARIDADDISLPKRFEKQFNFLEKHHNIFMVGSSAYVIDKDGKRIGRFFKYHYFPFLINHKLNRGANPIIHSTIMYRNEGIEYHDSDNIPANMDESIFFRKVIKLGKNIVNIPNFLIEYRINPNGISARTGLFTNNRWEIHAK